MVKNRMRTWWMLLFALLLVPTGYAMVTGKFALAGVCVAMLVAARLVGLPTQPIEDEGEDDADGD